MTPYQLEIKLQSPTIAASGEGWGAVIDTDIVFDDLGLPFIPSKRIKGCLKDAAQDVVEMLDLAKINFDMDWKLTYGLPGSQASAPVYFSNLTIENYDNTKQWLEYLMYMKNYENIISRETILKTFTTLRWQTAINDDGVAEDHSLRTARVIKKGFTFLGDIWIDTETLDRLDNTTPSQNSEKVLNTLILSCFVCNHMGTSRTRGFGQISCRLKSTDGSYLPIPKNLEELCMK